MPSVNDNSNAILDALLKQTAKLEGVAQVGTATQLAVEKLNDHVVALDKSVTSFSYGFATLQKDFDEQKKIITENRALLNTTKDIVDKLDRDIYGDTKIDGLLNEFKIVRKNSEKMFADMYGDGKDNIGISSTVKILKTADDKRSTLWGAAAGLWALGGTGALGLIIWLIQYFWNSGVPVGG